MARVVAECDRDIEYGFVDDKVKLVSWYLIVVT